MKKYSIMLGIVLLIVCGFGGYYVWCTYHPVIDIGITDNRAGENLQIQAPSIVYAGRVHKIADSVEQNLRDLMNQHEDMCQEVKERYKTSNIKLDIIVNEGKTILQYVGTATTKEDERVDVRVNKICLFEIDATIKN